MFDATRFAAAVAVATVLGLVLAVAAPWGQTEPPPPSAMVSAAESADDLMLGVYEADADEAALEAAIAAAYAADAFVRDVRPDAVDEASGRAEITAMIDPGETWVRRGDPQLLASGADELRYLGTYEVSRKDASDPSVRTVVCVITVADGVLQARECSHGGNGGEMAPAEGLEAELAAADDRFLKALGDQELAKLRDYVTAAFAPEAVFGVYWDRSLVHPPDDIRRGRDSIRFKFSDVMAAERLEPPTPLPAEAGSQRYLGRYDFTYDPGAGRMGLWEDAVCSGWLDGDLLERLDCFLPASTIVEQAD